MFPKRLISNLQNVKVLITKVKNCLLFKLNFTGFGTLQQHIHVLFLAFPVAQLDNVK